MRWSVCFFWRPGHYLGLGVRFIWKPKCPWVVAWCDRGYIAHDMHHCFSKIIMFMIVSVATFIGTYLNISVVGISSLDMCCRCIIHIWSRCEYFWVCGFIVGHVCELPWVRCKVHAKNKYPQVVAWLWQGLDSQHHFFFKITNLMNVSSATFLQTTLLVEFYLWTRAWQI